MTGKELKRWAIGIHDDAEIEACIGHSTQFQPAFALRAVTEMLLEGRKRHKQCDSEIESTIHINLPPFETKQPKSRLQNGTVKL